MSEWPTTGTPSTVWFSCPGSMVTIATACHSGLGDCTSSFTAGCEAEVATMRSRLPVAGVRDSSRGSRRKMPIPISAAGAASRGTASRKTL